MSNPLSRVTTRVAQRATRDYDLTDSKQKRGSFLVHHRVVTRSSFSAALQAFHVASILRGVADTKWEALKILGKFLQHMTRHETHRSSDVLPL